jgi:hypothetical protein
MAILRAKTGVVEMVLRPYRISEEGDPTWILTQLEVTQGGTKLMSTVLSLTKQDLARLRTYLTDVSAGRRRDFALTTTDYDLIIEARIMDGKDDVSIGFWTGEPYGLMHGYRFMVQIADLQPFAIELLSDENRTAPPAQLP